MKIEKIYKPAEQLLMDNLNTQIEHHTQLVINSLNRPESLNTQPRMSHKDIQRVVMSDPELNALKAHSARIFAMMVPTIRAVLDE